MKTKIILIACTLLTLALRVFNIEQKNMWFDEVYSWDLSQKTIKEIFIGSAGDIHPPLFYIILKYWTIIFSDTVFSMRMLSAALSILSLIFIYKISKRVVKQDYRIIFVFLLYALSPLNIYYSQEVRMLNLNLFLCLGSVYYFLKYTDAQSYKNGVPYLIFSILAVYTHYFAFLVIFTQLLIVFYNYFKYGDKKLIKRYPVYLVALMVMYVPWIPVMLSQVGKGQPWRTEQSAALLAKNVFEYFKEAFFSYYIYYDTAIWLYISFAGTSLIIIYLLYLTARFLKTAHTAKDKKDKSLFYIVMFFFIPLIAGIIVSAKNSILLSRYLSIIIPFLLISVTSLSFIYFKERTANIILSFILIISASGMVINYENSFKNNDYRKIISYIEQNYNGKDKIVIEPHYMAWSIKYYIKHNKTLLTEPVNLGWNFNEIMDSLKIKPDLGNIWISLDYSSMDTMKYRELPSLMQSLGYSLDMEKRFFIIPNKVSVQHYTKP